MVQERIDCHFLKIALPTQVDRLFTYSSERALPAGVRVKVPFGRANRPTVGVVLGEVMKVDLDFDPQKIKSIVEVVDQEPVYSPNLIELARWMADYYWYPYGEILKAMLPGSSNLVKTKTYHLSVEGLSLREQGSGVDAKLLRAVFGRFKKLGEATIKKKLSQHGEAGLEQWKQLGRSGYWQLSEQQDRRSRKTTAKVETEAPVQAEAAFELTEKQSAVFKALIDDGLGKAAEQRRPFLLWGVTGAGKTEIYLQLIAASMGAYADAQALVMVPEISLTPQMTRVFSARFPGKVAVVHSAMTDAERWAQLERIRHGQAQILVGPRSSVFAPFQRLALILVDEEHDSSYKQTTGLCYHGRDVAIVRAKLEGALVVLGSATPSMESFWNANAGKYRLLQLSERVHGRQLPQTELIPQKLKKRMGQRLPAKAEDMLADVPINERIIEELQNTLRRGEQAMVLVNRRGFAYYLFAIDKQEPIQCPDCSVSLTVHKMSKVLRCHYCDYRTSLAEVQREYGSSNLVSVGYGSEQAEDFLKRALPKARIVRVDSDTIQKKDTLTNVLQDFRNGKIDILVGTQILAKGHDFAKVTLICLLDIDQSLNLPDFRAGERTFQLMVQAAGRAGRAELPGQVMVQCQKPDHPVVTAALSQDYLQFARLEIGFRQIHGYPPFARMVLFELNCSDRELLERSANKLRDLTVEYFKRHGKLSELSVLGPAVPPIEVIRGRHRRTMMVSGSNLKAVRRLTAFIREHLTRLPKDVRFKVDVDPQSIL